MPHSQPTYGPRNEDGHCCPKGDGGNSTLTNQDEATILAGVTSGVPITYPPAGYDEPGRHA